MSQESSNGQIPRFQRMLKNVRSGVRAAPSGSGLDYYKVPDDGATHRLRILPGTYGGTVDGEAARNWYVEIYQHWYPDPKSSRGYNTSCYCSSSQMVAGKLASKEPCPFCSKWEALKDEERTATARIQEGGSAAELSALRDRVKRIKEELRATAFRTVYAVNVLDRGDGNKPKVFFMPKTAFDSLIGQYSNCCDEMGELLSDKLENDPEMADYRRRLQEDPNGPVNDELMAFADAFDASRGFDIGISKKTENKQTRYTVSINRKAHPALPDPEAIRTVLEAKVDLENMVSRELAAADRGDIELGLVEAMNRAGTEQLGSRSAIDPDTASFGGRGRGPAPQESRGRRDDAPARREPARRPPANDEIDYGDRAVDGYEAEGGEDAEGNVVDDADAAFVTPARPPRGREPQGTDKPAGGARGAARKWDF